MEKEHRGDSYVVNITPAGTTFPAVQVIRRKRKRQPGRVAQEADLGVLGRAADFEGEQGIDELARQIGRLILDNSPIVRSFRTTREKTQ